MRAMRLWRIATVVSAGAFAIAFARSPGCAGTIASFSAASSGSVTFSVADVTNTALAPNQNYTYNLTLTAGILPATISLSAPRIVGTSANAIPYAAFRGTCLLVTNSLTLGSYASPGSVQLGSSPVVCATISPAATGSITFSVALTLDTSPGPSSFAADSYASAPLAVIVDAP